MYRKIYVKLKDKGAYIMATKNLMKRVMTLTLAFLMVLSAVLVPVNAKAEELEPITAESYVLEVGEQWYIPVLNTTEDAKITYKIAKKKVATVDKDGLITAHKKGKCKIVITVKQGGHVYKAKAPITVKTTMTALENISRMYPEVNYWFYYCYDLAAANGWILEDGTYADELVGAWLDRYYTYVNGFEYIMEHPDEYTDEQMVEVQQGAAATMEPISEMIEVLLETY